MTDSDELSVTLDWAQIPSWAISQFLIARISRLRWLYWVGPALAGVLMVESLKKIAEVSGTPVARSIAEGSAVGFGLGFVTFILASIVVNNLLRRRFGRVIGEAPVRQSPNTLVLGTKGLRQVSSGGEITLRWPFVVDVIDYNKFTLILLSDVEYFPVPHASLPSGITPADLLTRIAAWRAAAAPPE